MQDLSEKFKVKVVNSTGIQDVFKVKINHHNEQEVLNALNSIPIEENREEIVFEIDSEILPYKGFEIMWHIKRERNINV